VIIQSDIEIAEGSPVTFKTTLAEMHGDDGTEGSISILSAPFGTQEEGAPGLMGVRASQLVVFEHDGRSGTLDLAKVFEAWVTEIGDRPEDKVPEFDQEEALRKNIERRKAEGREGAGL
jgi:hypothetical protein